MSPFTFYSLDIFILAIKIESKEFIFNFKNIYINNGYKILNDSALLKGLFYNHKAIL